MIFVKSNCKIIRIDIFLVKLCYITCYCYIVFCTKVVCLSLSYYIVTRRKSTCSVNVLWLVSANLQHELNLCLLTLRESNLITMSQFDKKNSYLAYHIFYATVAFFLSNANRVPMIEIYNTTFRMYYNGMLMFCSYFGQCN